ncbi:hypothetical protein Y032_0001g186 [Ancylostoma ceylanicum]|uniref:Uncharacterized protein n=1 Tax=Ancylostoma ceylanicum TaxID=53326 RepID=A0A016W4P8_9BILA|nr:hypothetical protein Y032_0001g186 [Ancylostoma ceylanicum]
MCTGLCLHNHPNVILRMARINFSGRILPAAQFHACNIRFGIVPVYQWTQLVSIGWLLSAWGVRAPRSMALFMLAARKSLRVAPKRHKVFALYRCGGNENAVCSRGNRGGETRNVPHLPGILWSLLILCCESARKL